MIIYRPNRGGLRESMAEAREFESVKAMKEYIVQQHTEPGRGPAFYENDIVIDDHPMNDIRTGWHDTKYVCARAYFEWLSYPICIGHCATEYGSLEQSQRMCKVFLEGR